MLCKSILRPGELSRRRKSSLVTFSNRQWYVQITTHDAQLDNDIFGLEKVHRPKKDNTGSKEYQRTLKRTHFVFVENYIESKINTCMQTSFPCLWPLLRLSPEPVFMSFHNNDMSIFQDHYNSIDWVQVRLKRNNAIYAVKTYIAPCNV